MVENKEKLLYDKEMAINIKDLETEQLIRAASERTGKGITETVRLALKQFDQAAPVGEHVKNARLARVTAIRRRASNRKILDARSADEILGYDDSGQLA